MAQVRNLGEQILSYPKAKLTVQLFEGCHSAGYDRLKEEGYSVHSQSESASSEELKTTARELSLIGIRSKTRLDRDYFYHSNRLLAAGLFCIGTDQVDLDSAAGNGVAVFNAPYSNTRSVSELAIGAIFALSRRMVEKSMQMHFGEWDKRSGGACEVRGKTLGLVGYGNIGAQLSVLAEAVGMRVVYFDLEEKLSLGNATKVEQLDELLTISDFVSLHVDGREANFGLFDDGEFLKMKPGACFINLSRGKVVDEVSLAKAIRNGHLGGAAIDVFPKEPSQNGSGFVSPLQGLSNVILTPHIGGSTSEAQKSISEFVANKLIEYVNTGSTNGCVNLPQLQLPAQDGGHRFLHIHHNVPGVIAQINNVLAKNDCNVLGQYLKTQESIGYVITDVNKEYGSGMIAELRDIKDTIRFRVLY